MSVMTMTYVFSRFVRMATSAGLALSWCSPVLAQGVAPTAFPPASGSGSLPQNIDSIFLPVEVFPRAGDTVVPAPMQCPIIRCSGVYGFTDPVTGRE